ncbi:MAG: hypothetical protein AAB672_00720 [Patescibacteria group bacterium]
MRCIKGLRDINTHGTLAREGRLVGVARDLHRIERRSGFSGNESWNGSVDNMVFKKSAKTQRLPHDLFQELVLKKKIQNALVQQIQESIAEMEMFAGEGVAGALAELQRLGTKLSRLVK